MILEQIVEARRSVRGFLPEPVPRPLLRRIFQCASQAPSNCNVQPWIIHIAEGDSLARLGKVLGEAASRGLAPNPDFDGLLAYPGIYRDRQVDTARQLYGAMGIDRADIAARNAALLRNFDFFDAPHAAFLFAPDWVKPRDIADLGMYAQTLMLLMTAHGLASCPQAALGQYPDLVREELRIPPAQRLLFGLSFGYADENAAANRFRTERAAFEATTTFHD